MRRNSFLTFLKEKSFLIVLTLMLVSAGTMAALFALGGDDAAEENQVAKQEVIPQETASGNDGEKNAEKVNQPSASENTIEKNKSTDTFKSKSVTGTTKISKTTDTNEETKKDTSGTESAQIAIELEDQYLEAEEMAEVSGADVVAEGFSEISGEATEVPVLNLKWPVSGEVLLEFSMDHSIYFPTLAQYQYSPAMIISASEGTEVFTAAAGTVTDVGKTNEYGHYVTMDLGDGFEITYGQLFDITTEAFFDYFKNKLEQNRPNIEVVINNAGVGYIGEFKELPIDEQIKTIDKTLLIQYTSNLVTLFLFFYNLYNIYLLNSKILSNDSDE